MEAKKIIITGGATRIGSAIAKSLAGYDIDIIIHFNKSKKSAQQLKSELEEMGSKVHLIKADLSKINQVKKIVTICSQKNERFRLSN
jgi:Short-chain dehydrogenases of various substrate specificities